MSKCKDCKNSCYLLDEYDKPYFWCNVFEDNFNEERECLCIAYRPKTNADRIRSMTDEQLAEFLEYGGFWDEICDECKHLDGCQDSVFCSSRTLKWLQKEIK